LNKKLIPIEIQIYPDGRMDSENAAKYLEISEKTLAIYRCNGTSPKFIKRGRRVFYFQSDLDEWLNEIPKCTSTSQARLRKEINNA